MTPDFLNPPPSSPFPDLVEQKEDQHEPKLFINSQDNEATSSFSSPTFFYNSTQDQRGGDVIIGSQQRNQKAVNNIDVFTSTSQNLPTSQRDHQDIDINREDHQFNMSSNNKSTINKGSVKQYWMSSKMRLMQKMSNPETAPAAAATTDHHQYQYKGEKSAAHKAQHSPRQDKAGEPIFSFSQRDSTSGTVIRICSDCNTTTTPLWRSGPRGPKSLCNACGIRQRKARRAMAEAAAAAANVGLVVGADHHSSTTITTNYTPIKTAAAAAAATSYYKSQYHTNKEIKKSRAQYKNKLKLKLVDTTATSPNSEIRNTNNNDNNKLCLRKLSFGLNDNYCSSAFSGVFPNDVAEAAVLLMELSCGFVHS